MMKVCLYKQCDLCWNLFIPGTLKFWHALGWVWLCDQPEIKTLDAEPLLPIDDISHVVLQFVAGGIKCILCDFTGREILEAYAWFPPDGAPCTFILYWFWFISFHIKHGFISWVLWVKLGVVLGSSAQREEQRFPMPEKVSTLCLKPPKGCLREGGCVGTTGPLRTHPTTTLHFQSYN